LVVAGVWAVFSTDQEAGTATLVAGGLTLIIVAAVGGMHSLKWGSLEAVFSEASGGNDETALDALQILFAASNPSAASYIESVQRALQQAVANLGGAIRAVDGVPGVNAIVSGSRIGVDIRPATAFSISRVHSTYRSLLDPVLPLVDGLLTVVRADDGDQAVASLTALKMDMPHVVVAWREGASVERLEQALAKIREAIIAVDVHKMVAGMLAIERDIARSREPGLADPPPGETEAEG
jgi:hypothetical protein